MSGAAPAGALVEREEELAAIVRGMRRIAVLGIQDEDRPDAPAHTIPALLDAMGFEVLGINPTRSHALGRPTLASVAELPAGVDVLDVFRRSAAIPAHTDELLAGNSLASLEQLAVILEEI